MIFASKAFFVFLPIVLILYHGFSRREHRYRVLLAASWLFYAWVPPHYWPVLFLLTLIDFLAGREIQKATDPALRKRWLIASIVANLGLLFAFKYTPFVCETALGCGELFGLGSVGTISAIVLPLGISFHTFQGISYTVDVYRKRIRAVDSFTDYALFVSFFPQLAAGPIVRAAEFLPQMAQPPRVSAVPKNTMPHRQSRMRSASQPRSPVHGSTPFTMPRSVHRASQSRPGSIPMKRSASAAVAFASFDTTTSVR